MNPFLTLSPPRRSNDFLPWATATPSYRSWHFSLQSFVQESLLQWMVAKGRAVSTTIIRLLLTLDLALSHMNEQQDTGAREQSLMPTTTESMGMNCKSNISPTNDTVHEGKDATLVFSAGQDLELALKE